MMAANKQTTTSSRRGAAVRLLLLITTIVMSSHPSTAATTAADAHHPNANDTEEDSSSNVASIIDNNEEAATSSIKKKRKKSRRAEERLYWWPTYSPTTYVPTAWEGDTWLPTKKPTSWSKPTGKPTAWSKPTDKPTSWSKPTGKPTSWSKPTGKPTSWSKPTGKPTSWSKPTGKPTSWSKPTGKPTSWSKPTNPPWQSGDKYRIYNRDGNPVGYDTQGWDYHFWWNDKIAAVRGECKAMFDQDSDYVAKAIRLLFHDCKGDSEGYGCDGCVNLDHVDNLGLYGIMQKLSPIVKKNEAYLSRADTWVLCALTALEISTDRFYPMTLIGRHNCKDSNDIGHGGQYHNIYGDEVHTSALFHHFNKYFGFDAKCTVAAMGLHGISTMRPENSGHGNGSNPSKWVRNASHKLSNSYYQGFDYDWTYEVRDNYDQPKFGPKPQWYNGFSSNRVVLLNADVSLKWNFEEYVDQNGDVDCKVSGQDPRNGPSCPLASQTYGIVEDYAENNSLFLNDLKDCMIQMYTTGYRDGYDASYFMYYKDGSTPYPSY